MNKLALLSVYFSAKSILDRLKSGQQLSQEMIERLDRAVTECRLEAEDND